jgi:hypothetical protein
LDEKSESISDSAMAQPRGDNKWKKKGGIGFHVAMAPNTDTGGKSLQWWWAHAHRRTALSAEGPTDDNIGKECVDLAQRFKSFVFTSKGVKGLRPGDSSLAQTCYELAKGKKTHSAKPVKQAVFSDVEDVPEKQGMYHPHGVHQKLSHQPPNPTMVAAQAREFGAIDPPFVPQDQPFWKRSVKHDSLPTGTLGATPRLVSKRFSQPAYSRSGHSNFDPSAFDHTGMPAHTWQRVKNNMETDSTVSKLTEQGASGYVTRHPQQSAPNAQTAAKPRAQHQNLRSRSATAATAAATSMHSTRFLPKEVSNLDEDNTPLSIKQHLARNNMPWWKKDAHFGYNAKAHKGATLVKQVK